MVKREVVINFPTNISIYSIIYCLIIVFVFDVPSSKTIFIKYTPFFKCVNLTSISTSLIKLHDLL